MPDKRESEPRSSLAQMFGLVHADGPTWRSHEYAMILEHQLDAAAARLEPIDGATTRSAAGGRRVRELLLGEAPSVAHLHALRKWAKRQRAAPGGAVPGPVATVVYFAAIAAAWRAHGVRISALSNERVRRGLAWCAAQDWRPTELAVLFEDALRSWPTDETPASG